MVAASAGLLLCGASLSVRAETFSALHEFSNGSDGGFPEASLVQDSAGNYYGTTQVGGGTGCGGNGCGTVFRIASDGTESIVYAFQGGNDGDDPLAGLIIDGSGNLYGTAAQGGNAHCLYSEKPNGCGTVFKLSPEGVETTLYAFAGGKDGSVPRATLAMDQSGNLYGATIEGGGGGKKARENCSDRRGCGTVFEISANGTETVLHAFHGGKDGSFPSGNVILDAGGNVYGTTIDGGGATACSRGCGAVYRIAPDGKERVLYRFQGGSDGESPSGLVMNGAGDFFGATEYGGATTCKCGTIFQVTPKGREKVLYAFKGGSDGDGPLYSPLAIDATGNLYGTTSWGGGNGCGGSGCGTVFEFSTDKKETIPYALTGGADGYLPIGGVTLDASGNLFGTTYYGGDTACQGANGGCGVVFEIENQRSGAFELKK
jgi:uncharacterized repeat protein (TIGR03803 family)